MSFKAPNIQIPAPVAPTAPNPAPSFGTLTPGQKPQANATQASSIAGTMFANPANSGNKTLLGT